MNPDTGHLIQAGKGESLKESLAEAYNKVQDELTDFGQASIRAAEAGKKLKEALINNEYIPVPKELEHAVKCKLKGRKEAMVSLTSGGKLAKWAKEKRKERREAEKEMVDNCNAYYSKKEKQNEKM